MLAYFAWYDSERRKVKHFMERVVGEGGAVPKLENELEALT
jgi:hypothetical protein